MTPRLLLLLVVAGLSAAASADVVRISTADADYSSSSSEEALPPMDDVGMEEDDNNVIVAEERVEDKVHASIMAALKRPDMKRQMGQILPIIRAMSPPQRLTLAALITSQVMDASPPTLNEVSAMFGIDPDAPEHIKRNITSTLLLPLSYDIARMFKGRSQAPQAQEYRGFRPPPSHWGHRRPQPGGGGPNRRNTHVYTAMLPPPPPPPRQPPVDLTVAPDKEHCEFFSQSLCLEVSDYPREAILASLRASEGALDDVLMPDRIGEESMASEVADRRQDGGGAPASMCTSHTKLARPKRARTTGGEWKYIVNTGHYVQTLRLEMCQNPQESCSYISDNFRSECSQVFNYHRLLTWDENKGLHMDVFKVPTCCSCQVKGYAVNFPPKGSHNSIQKPHEHFPGTDFAVDENFGGSNAQQYDNFNVRAHDRPQFNEPHLIKQGAAIEQSLREQAFNHPAHGDLKISMQNVETSNFNRGIVPPHYNIHNANSFDRFHNGQNQHGFGGGAQFGNSLKRQDSGQGTGLGQGAELGLTPPRETTYFDNNIRRSRNQTGYMDKRVYEEPDEGGSSTPPYRHPPPLAPSSIAPHSMNPGRRVPTYHHVNRGNPPPSNLLRPDTIERPPNTSQHGIVDSHSDRTATTEAAEAKNEIQTDGKRVNYSYHPIIDFFKTRAESDKLESRSGEGWRPIVGPKT